MNIDELAEAAATGMAERLAGGVVDGVTNLITDRMRGSRTGSRALEQMGSGDTELAASVLSDELSRDPSFARAVAEALGRPLSQQSSVTIGERARVRGDVAGGNIDKRKQFHIGSIRFGGGGLATLIAVVLLGGGGAGYGIYNAVVYTPGEGYVSQTEHRDRVTSSGSSVDLDAENQSESNGDGVADITLDVSSVLATGGALLVRLPGGTVPEPESCDRALEQNTARVDNLKQGELLCVRTSRRALAAVTISGMNVISSRTAVYTLDWGYWAPAA